jgi:hypothetical protein
MRGRENRDVAASSRLRLLETRDQLDALFALQRKLKVKRED